MSKHVNKVFMSSGTNENVASEKKEQEIVVCARVRVCREICRDRKKST